MIMPTNLETCNRPLLLRSGRIRVCRLNGSIVMVVNLSLRTGRGLLFVTRLLCLHATVCTFVKSHLLRVISMEDSLNCW